MVLGFNHNVRYKGELFHVQTEDSGLDNPHIVTLLYKNGAILASRKTCYADILKMENLEIVVEELMKEQHKEMMRRLKSGEFDASAFSPGAVSSVGGGDPSTITSPPPAFLAEPDHSGHSSDAPEEVFAAVPGPAAAHKKKNTGLDAAVLAFFDARGT